MKVATLGILQTDTHILLGFKKTGEIGEQTYNAPGGKLEPGESLLECLIREFYEEVRITVLAAVEVAIIRFFVAGELDFILHIFIITEHSGDSVATESMQPAWFLKTNVPYAKMLPSDSYWFPKLIAGEEFVANVNFEKPGEGFIPPVEFFPYIRTLE